MEPSRKASSQTGTLLRIAGTVLTLALLLYLLSQQGWQEIVQAFQQIALWRLFLALALMLVSRLAVAARWHILLRSASLKINFFQSLRITFAGLFATNFLPTTIGGDLVRLAGVIQLKLDAAICTASLVVDRLVGMAGMAMVVPFGIPSFLAAHQAQTWLTGGQVQKTTLPLVTLGHSVWGRIRTLTNRIVEALSLWLKNPRALLVSLLFSWVHMVCVFGILWLLLAGLGENISFWITAGLYSLVYFVTLLPVSINGYGLQEVSMTFVFSSFGGASIHHGLTVALLFRTLMMIASLPGALFVPTMVQKNTQT